MIRLEARSRCCEARDAVLILQQRDMSPGENRGNHDRTMLYVGIQWFLTPKVSPNSVSRTPHQVLCH
jgi:hypothetical protein